MHSPPGAHRPPGGSALACSRSTRTGSQVHRPTGERQPVVARIGARTPGICGRRWLPKAVMLTGCSLLTAWACGTRSSCLLTNRLFERTILTTWQIIACKSLCTRSSGFNNRRFDVFASGHPPAQPALCPGRKLFQEPTDPAAWQPAAARTGTRFPGISPRCWLPRQPGGRLWLPPVVCHRPAFRFRRCPDTVCRASGSAGAWLANRQDRSGRRAWRPRPQPAASSARQIRCHSLASHVLRRPGAPAGRSAVLASITRYGHPAHWWACSCSASRR